MGGQVIANQLPHCLAGLEGTAAMMGLENYIVKGEDVRIDVRFVPEYIEAGGLDSATASNPADADISIVLGRHVMNLGA